MKDKLKEILIKHKSLNNNVWDVVDNSSLYQEVFGYFMNSGEMPYDVMKGHHGNPDEWVAEQLLDSGLVTE